jgi:hypothetical protein
MRSASRWVASLCLFLAVAVAAACGSGKNTSVFQPDGGEGGGGSTDASDKGDVLKLFDSGLGEGGLGGTGPLAITPVNQTLNVTIGAPAPTINYVAKLGSQTVTASWAIDRGELGTLNPSTGLFTAGQTVGGTGHVTATYGKMTATTSVTVFLHYSENGGAGIDAGTGAGGVGGVGGYPPGGTVAPGTVTVLNGTPTADPNVSWLYPYDKTVWPQGILAPLLQWNPGTNNFDAVYIHITEAAFEYQGYFSNSSVPAMQPFVNEIIPQAAWAMMAYSNGGEPVNISLVFDAGGKAIGPITETWSVALGTLEGTVYYNSYGTRLATNYCCDIDSNPFGGATLGIQPGATNPTLVAGSNTECRVCHSVAAGGSTLITQQGTDYSESSAYSLAPPITETAMAPTSGVFAWPALFPDGTFLFSDSSPLAGNSTAASALYSVPSGTAITSTGLAAGLGAATPTFSPDGTQIAFNFYAGTGADQKSLAWMSYTQATNTFGAVTTAWTPTACSDADAAMCPVGSGVAAVFPSFLPTNNAVVFENQTVYNGRDFGGTRSTCDASGTCSNIGAEGELWWIDQKTKTAARLDQANGLGYVPTGPNGHGNDSELNYEPTVNPVASGGYAWVVFTSRRLYGNIATINPYWSDPRFHDISTTPTTKKLWVAAIDLNATPGTDPSHPAFYLPGQELLAGNARGYWVVNPCLPNGTTCSTGDQCCGGYCRAGDGGALVCSPAGPGCSNLYEKCSTTSDCCGASMGVECIDMICSAPTPK